MTTSLDYPVSSICWNRDGTQLLTGGTTITLWEYSLPVTGLATPASEPELVKSEILEEVEEDDNNDDEEEGEGGIVFGKKKADEDEEEEKRGALSQLWRTDVPMPIKHLKFSPSAELFASCGDVSGHAHFPHTFDH